VRVVLENTASTGSDKAWETLKESFTPKEREMVSVTKGERNGQCKNSSESQTQSCVYNLLKSNISDSDAGIYYCAVAACGEILFGEGTQLNFRGKVKCKCLALNVEMFGFISYLEKQLINILEYMIPKTPNLKKKLRSN